MKWKIYFGILSLLALLSSAGIFYLPQNEIVPSVVHLLIFITELVGLYAYIYSKKIFPSFIWKYFFWLNILLDIFFILYAFYPNIPIAQWYSYLFPGIDTSAGEVLIAVAADIPLLYALFKISKNEFYIPKKTKMKYITPGVPQWGMIQTALWGYSFIITFIFTLSVAIPMSTDSSATSSQNDSLFGALIISPLVLFWVMIIIQYKQYKKNWWRLTLVANGIVFSLLMLSGIIFSEQEVVAQSDFEILSFLQFLVILLALYVFGKEQFDRAQNKKISS